MSFLDEAGTFVLVSKEITKTSGNIYAGFNG